MSVRTSSSSSSSSDAGFEEVKSPRKLQRSIWNQVMAPQAPDTNHSSAPSSSSLSLRSLDLTLPPTLPAILLHCQPHASHIHSLDIGYSLLSADSLPLLLPTLPCLEELLAVKCGLVELNITTQWPDKLKVLDLSRNKLRCFPQGMDRLLHLKKVNLSGNLIREVDPSVLRLPQLDKLYLLSNPIANIPKVVCREGVLGMRQYFKVEPLTTPGSNSSTSSFLPPNRRASFDRVRNVLLQHSESAAESGYDSSAKLASTSTSCSSLNNLENEEGEEMEEGGLSLWPRFCQRALPDGYTEVCEASLCQVYLPEGCRQNISVDIVKDVSLHPSTRPNELLITPVIRISPHGLTFDSEKPAILVLSHCTKPSGCIHRLVPLCSSTAPSQPPVWERMAPTTECEIFKNCVMFTATHFSLFAVVSVLPYPTAAAQISPNDGGTLFVPDFPGFSVRFPANCIVSPDPSTSVQATVYYTDLPYCLQNALAQASASVGLEPHGIQFTTPVHVTIPVPDYTAIMATFRGAYLQLWYSPYDSDGLFDWELVEDAAISVSDSPNGYVATFSVSHFSLFELLWSVCRETVTRLGYGAGSLYQHLSSRASYVSVRCQVFMSPPLPDLSFGLLVTVYKFGEPLSDLSNYRWLLADTGSKHVFLRTGEVAVVLDGHFSPRSDLGESEELRREAVIDFSGQDFCLRFEFALRLREEVGLPLQDHQLLGKLRVGPPNGSAPIDLNLIKPAETGLFYASGSPIPSSTQPASSYMECTPPWTPDTDIVFPDSIIGRTTCAPIFDTAVVHPGKRRRHANDPPTNNSSAGRSIRAKRRLLVKEGRLDGDKFLMKVARTVGAKWEEMGVALGLDFGTIKSTVSDVGGRPEHMKAFYVLQEWKGRACEEFTYAKLASALEEAGMHSCAQIHCYCSLDPGADLVHED